MEKNHEGRRLDLVHRTIAAGLAVAATGFIAASVAVIFAGDVRGFGGAFIRVALEPVRALFGA